MEEMSGKIADDSIWITATPTTMTKSLPFYITEAGHFTVFSDYKVKRDLHDSFLFLYTHSGEGIIKTGDTNIRLPSGYAVIIDCHTAHEYYSQSDTWNFLWIHFDGSAVKTMFDILYPNNTVYNVNMESDSDFKHHVTSIIKRAAKNDIKNCIDNSCRMHQLINSMFSSSLTADENNQKKDFGDDIHTVLEYIKNNYSQSISIDDMIETIHVSKYHFIRRFSRIMGMTPYNYLINYRITMAKTLLRTTNKTVAEIAEQCGFMDTSNFITKFKRSTNQKPLQYRRDFT